MTKQNQNYYTEEKIKEIFLNSIFEKAMDETLNSDVNINHLENLFTNETYYSAMKIVPLLERKVLYLYYIEKCRLNEICKRLKLQKNEVIKLRAKGIMHFKSNLATLYKSETYTERSKRKWKKDLTIKTIKKQKS